MAPLLNYRNRDVFIGRHLILLTTFADNLISTFMKQTLLSVILLFVSIVVYAENATVSVASKPVPQKSIKKFAIDDIWNFTTTLQAGYLKCSVRRIHRSITNNV